MQAEKTLEYDRFKTISCNRPIDQKHVNRLIDAIHKRNLLHLHPIVCNQAMEIIDGQHRLEAARQLGVEVHFVIDGSISKSDIATINSTSKNWQIIDYINYWTTEGRCGFDKLSEFMIDNPLIPPSTVLQLFSGDHTRDTNSLKDGNVKVNNYEQAYQIGTVIKEYYSVYNFRSAYDRNFILAVLTCFNVKGYDHDIMRRKLEFQSRSLVKCISRQQYLEMIDEIYNYGSSKNRLKLAA